MNSRGTPLALRRELLVARSRMLRLRAVSEAQALRGSLTLRGVAGSLRESLPARSALFGALLLVLGSARLRRVLRLAGVALGIARAVSAFRGGKPRA